MISFEENRNCGQLFGIERKTLYDLVKQSRPLICVECGTWQGGGSTYYIASALKENGCGKLFTWEIHKPFFDVATDFFNNKKPDLKEVIQLHLEDFHIGLNNHSCIEFAFLDGPDTPEYNIKSLEMLSKKMPLGKFVALHDWKIEKCSKVKQWITEHTKDFKIISEITYTETGLGVLQKV
jgi:predicted O-methyltransferase YrrM